MRFGGQRLAQRRVVQALVLAAQNHPQAAGKRVQRFERGIHAGGFGIVIEIDAAHVAHEFQTVLDGVEGAHGRGDGCVRRRRRGRRRSTAASTFSMLWRPRMGISPASISELAVEHQICRRTAGAGRHLAPAAEPLRRGGGERGIADADRHRRH